MTDPDREQASPASLHFDALADTYAASRPPYPPELWADVVGTGVVGPGRRALDLGAGTGEAAGVLHSLGCDVVAVEPGHRMAAILRSRHPGIRVEETTSEEREWESAAFDVVTVATAIHWFDLGIVLPAVHRSLKKSGRLLVWRHVFGDPDAPPTAFRRTVQRITARRDRVREGAPESLEATAAAIAASGLFTIERTRRYSWQIDLTANRVLALFRTFSDWSTTEVEEASDEVDRLGGMVTEHYTSWLVDAAPVAGRSPASTLER